MRRTARETEVQTLTRLITAMDRQHPVTITYVKADGSTTVRTIEIYDVTVSAAGDIVLKAMDRQSGESRSFRLDRIQAYTVHRTAYVVPRDVTVDDGRTPRPSLATVTLLAVDLGVDPVALLADHLAAA